jgi:hypothetical protein
VVRDRWKPKGTANKWPPQSSEFERVREKLKVVIDTSVFVAAIFWQGSARDCLVRFARREFEIVVSDPILREFAETAWELKVEEDLAQNPQPWLNWINSRATITRQWLTPFMR